MSKFKKISVKVATSMLIVSGAVALLSPYDAGATSGGSTSYCGPKFTYCNSYPGDTRQSYICGAGGNVYQQCPCGYQTHC
ncbi:MAG: hypothetical protein IPP42_09935 [Saprospiraceae bacterium]|nr:hypothetical protein [Saprospiraceae bacterium]